jgi:hypothetical protein
MTSVVLQNPGVSRRTFMIFLLSIITGEIVSLVVIVSRAGVDYAVVCVIIRSL